MKTFHKIFAAFCAALEMAALRTFGQSSFQNLNFESANVQGYSPGSLVPVALALPGWYVNGNQPGGDVYYDDVALGGAPNISVIDAQNGFYPVLQGAYSLLLQAGGSTTIYSATVSQSSLVPANAQSLQMEAVSYNQPFTVSLGGHQINMVPLETYANYTEYGGNISSLAGQVANLVISEPVPTGENYPGTVVLDNIAFSPNTIPEPATWTLLLCGAGLWGVARRWRRA